MPDDTFTPPPQAPQSVEALRTALEIAAINESALLARVAELEKALDDVMGYAALLPDGIDPLEWERWEGVLRRAPR